MEETGLNIETFSEWSPRPPYPDATEAAAAALHVKGRGLPPLGQKQAEIRTEFSRRWHIQCGLKT